MEANGGSTSNVTWKLGAKSQKELLADAKDALLITGFIGGNSNSGTGDFSVGVVGFLVRNGEIAEPVAEMNLSGNHLEFWKKLVAIGNDPFPYSAMRSPTTSHARSRRSICRSPRGSGNCATPMGCPAPPR